MKSNSSKTILTDVSLTEDGVYVESPSIDGDAGISTPWNVEVRVLFAIIRPHSIDLVSLFSIDYM